MDQLEQELSEDIWTALVKLHELKQVLHSERHALADQNIDEIHKNIIIKQQLFSGLEMCWQTLNQKFIRLEIDVPLNNKFASVLKSPRLHDATKLMLQKLVDGLRQCESANNINGSIINLGIKRINSTLNVIFKSRRQTNTYDESGHNVVHTLSTTSLKV